MSFQGRRALFAPYLAPSGNMNMPNPLHLKALIRRYECQWQQCLLHVISYSCVYIDTCKQFLQHGYITLTLSHMGLTSNINMVIVIAQ